MHGVCLAILNEFKAGIGKSNSPVKPVNRESSRLSMARCFNSANLKHAGMLEAAKQIYDNATNYKYVMERRRTFGEAAFILYLHS